jgi:hypothetical protein
MNNTHLRLVWPPPPPVPPRKRDPEPGLHVYIYENDIGGWAMAVVSPNGCHLKIPHDTLPVCLVAAAACAADEPIKLMVGQRYWKQESRR